MHAKTTVLIGPEVEDNKMWLNGNEVNLEKSERVQRVIAASKIIHCKSFF